MFLILIIFIFISLYLISVLRNSINQLCKCTMYHLTKTFLRASYKNAVSKLHLAFAGVLSLLPNCSHHLWMEKKNNVTPVHIKDSMEQTENNRPISLLCIISKDLESCVCITLNNYVKQFTSMTFCEIGFCTTQLLSILMPCIGQNLEKYSDRYYLLGLG